MTQLFELCRATRKEWRAFGRGHHNDTVAEAGYFEAVDEFLRQHVVRRGLGRQ